jgi:hypothetical protein
VGEPEAEEDDVVFSLRLPGEEVGLSILHRTVG